MVILVHRAKLFMLGNQRLAVPHKPAGQPVPDWVANSPTFLSGIKDGSIVDLTPPARPVQPALQETKVEEGAEEDSEPKSSSKTADKRKPAGTVTAQGAKVVGSK